MDVHTLSLRTRFRETFESRLRKISGGPSFLLLEKHRKAVLFVSALVLGFLAYRVTSNEARVDWLRESRPRIDTWEVFLFSKNFVPVLDPKELETLSPELPYLRSARDPRIWITEDSRVLVFFEPEGVRIYTLGKGTPSHVNPGTWEALGYGWDALQSLSQRTIPIPDAPSRLPKLRVKSHDPRAINY